MLISGIAVYFVESKINGSPIKSIGDAFWWLLVTISTVGYGDIVPKSEIGKFLGSLTIVVGVAFFTMITGSIASAFVEMRLNERRGLGKVREKNHVVILGKNEEISDLIETLMALNNKTIVIVSQMEEDEFEELKEHFPQADLKFVKGDYTKDQVLRRASIQSASSVVILSDTSKTPEEADERALITTLAVRSLSQNVRIIAEVMRTERIKHITRAGANEVIHNGEFNPIFLGSFVVSPALHSFVMELLKNIRFGVWPIPRSFIGKSFKECFEILKKEKNVIAVGIISEKKKVVIEDILTGDKSIDEFVKRKLEEAEVDVFGEEKECNVIFNPNDEYEISENDSLIVYLR